MTDKEKLHQILSSLWKNDNSVGKTYYNQALQDVQTAIDLQEEPVSEELGEIVLEGTNFNKSWYAHPELAFKAGAKWQKQQDQSTIELAEDHAMLAGMEKMKEEMMKNLWKPADGDELPEYEREVVVLHQPYPLEGSEYAVGFAHRPDPKGWDGTNIATGKIEHYTPKTYDKGGWNIHNIKWFLDLELPVEVEKFI